jgi:hypothetical protein
MTRWLVLLIFFGLLLMDVHAALAPNRGKQLFVIVEKSPEVSVITMTPAERDILAHWNRYNPTYDFISAVVITVADGSKVRFTRYVMKSDYIPRVETVELFFPYTKQAQHHFFDIGTIIGFYRNSPEDFDAHELWPQIPKRLTKRSSQPLAVPMFSFQMTSILNSATKLALASGV